MVELRQQEQTILETLRKLQGKATMEQLISKSRLDAAAVMRAIMTLQNEDLVKAHEKKQTFLKLNEEGKCYAKHGLPEHQIWEKTIDHEMDISKIADEIEASPSAISPAIGRLKQEHMILLHPEKETIVALPINGENPWKNREELLTLLDRNGTLVAETLTAELRETISILKRMNLLKMEEKIQRTFELTSKGRTVILAEKISPEITQLSQELIVSGKWREVKLQKYNIEASVPKVWSGKKHPYMQFLEEVKAKLVTLGFKEMTGTVVETAFFNFDALYTPQDHPARELSGIYYVKHPTEGSVNAYGKIVNNVKKAHENGWITGSTGWRYRYSLKQARRLILRGHGTCLSARTLVSKGLKVPGRYFSIARCYRPEVVDKTHLTEFNQVEGIVIDKDLTLQDLLGVLKKFALEMAEADKVKFKPDYFPFTEPSVELSAYKEGYGWIEFGGSGIFRPEVTVPLGIKEPVIAWGLGIDRLFMMRAGIEEISYIFSRDLDWIRRKAVV